MARIRRILIDLIHQAISGHRRAFERFDPHLRWGLSATSHEAHARGIQLLKENLSPAQHNQYIRYGCFDVAGGETGRHYRVKHGSQMNVEQLDKKGRLVRFLCFAPEGGLAIGDVMLAQKLALELFESDTLKVANRHAPDLFVSGPMP
jgi:hypothetical protein